MTLIERNSTQQSFDDLLNAIDQDINTKDFELLSTHIKKAKFINQQLLSHDTKAFDKQQSSLNMMRIQDDVLMECLMEHYEAHLKKMQSS